MPGRTDTQALSRRQRSNDSAKPEAIRPRDPERTKRDILKAARDEFSERGLDGARVDAIAARAKANKRLLYHYWGNKEALYSAVLLDAYKEIRRGERELKLSRHEPVEAIDRLVRFTFRHFLAHPWFTRLLAIENLRNAEFVRHLPADELKSPVIDELHDIVGKGHERGLFRLDVDPLQLYISIISLCYFYVSNMKTMSIVFHADLSQFAMIQEREAQAVEMVLDYLRTKTPPPTGLESV